MARLAIDRSRLARIEQDAKQAGAVWFKARDGVSAISNKMSDIVTQITIIERARPGSTDELHEKNQNLKRLERDMADAEAKKRVLVAEYEQADERLRAAKLLLDRCQDYAQGGAR